MDIQVNNGRLVVLSGQEQQQAVGGTPSPEGIYLRFYPAPPSERSASLTLAQALELVAAIAGTASRLPVRQ